MTRRSNMRASLIGLALSTMISVPSFALAQMSGGMGHDKMTPMGDDKMPMPDKMPPKKPGCCGKMGDMAAKPAATPAKSAKPKHQHRAKAKAKPTAARRAPTVTAKPSSAAKPAPTAKPAPAKPMDMPMPKDK